MVSSAWLFITSAPNCFSANSGAAAGNLQKTSHLSFDSLVGEYIQKATSEWIGTVVCATLIYPCFAYANGNIVII